MKAEVYGALPAEAAAAWPDQSALYFKGKDITFSELDRAIDVAARGLMAQGVEAGDKVASDLLKHDFPVITNMGLALLWLSALVTLYTGWDYMRAGLRHMID